MIARPSSPASASDSALRASCTLVASLTLWSCTSPAPRAPMATPEQVRNADTPAPDVTNVVPGAALDGPYVAPTQAGGAREPGRLDQPPGAADLQAQATAQAAQTPPVAAAPQVANVTTPKSPISGYLSSRYRLRWTPNDSDQDLYEIAAVDYADPDTPWLSAHVMGRLAADLDGTHGSTSVFDSLEDTYDGAVVGTLYHAYVDLAPTDAMAQVRLGRQLDYLTPELAYFDGVNLHTNPLGSNETQTGFYGGTPVHTYESSSSGDSLFGAYIENRPWKGGRLRADWMHYDDTALFGPVSNDLYGISLWHTSPQGWSTDAQYTRLEDQDRDLRLRGQYATDDGRTSARLSLYRLFNTQFEQVLDLDMFSSALQEYFPFTQTTLIGTHSFSDEFSLDGGVDVRRVDDLGDVGTYNRNWERYYVTGNIHDCFVEGLTASLTLDDWNGDGQDIQTWGADLSREFGKSWRGSAGSYYSLYKYDLYSNSERDDVRTYYARAQWKRSDTLAWDFSYEYEDDNFEQYQTLRLGAVWRF
jgi:hypothetical protein